jgi:PAS domain S-box-containing protein
MSASSWRPSSAIVDALRTTLDGAPDSRPLASILLVDDLPANLLTLEAILQPLGQRTVRANSGQEALALLSEGDFAVVVLDIMMPGIDGFGTADRIRAQVRGKEIPIIFVTAGDTPELDGYARGAVDFLRKPLDAEVVRAKVAMFVELYRAREQIRMQAARLAAQERTAQAHTAALLNASLDAVIGMDLSGLVTEFNGAAEAMFGRRREDTVGRSMAELLIPPRLREAHQRGLARHLATGERRALDRRIEVTAMRADGSEFPIELAIRRVATDGLPTFLGYARDLSERHAAERERTALLARAQAGEEQFRTLANTMPLLAWYADPDGSIRWYNSRWHEYTGMPVDQQDDWPWQRVHDPADLPRIVAKWQGALATGEPWEDQFRLRRRDGVFRWFLSRAVPLLDAHGRTLRWFGTNVDIDDRKQTEAALERARRETEAILAAAGDGIYGVDNEGRTTFVNPAAAQLLGRSAEELRGQIAHDLVHHTRRDGTPYPREECPISRAGRDGVVLRRDDEVFWRKDGGSFPIEYASTPIRDVDGLSGAVVVFRDITERDRADRARAFLAQASEAFASSLDYEATLQTVVALAVPQVADWCAVEIVGSNPGDRVTRAVGHVDPSKIALAEELRRRYPPDPDAPSGVAHVLRTGRSELHEDISPATLERVARDSEHLRILNELGLRSAIVVPITSHDRTLGAITFIAAESGRRYGPSDLATAEDLARRAAIAIENARLYRATQLAESRNRFLAEATETLASSLDYTVTLERVARLAVPMVAESAAVYRLEASGVIRLIALAAKDPAWEEMGRELDGLLPLRIEQQDRTLPRVVLTGRAEMLPDLSDALRETWSPTSRAEVLVRQLAIRSYMVVPLVVRGSVIGAIALTSSASGRRFESDDLALAGELARRAGLAVENAQLYRDAQDANRLKDEFLATVSHELRTPLTAILGWLHLLRTGRPAQVARAIDTIERNALAQARIVDDVLDVSRIITGKLRLEIEPVNLADVLRSAVDTVRPAAEAKEIALITTLHPAAAETAGDSARLQQIAWNLLSNAIKFTPHGGRIEVRLEREGSDARVRVSDTGQGIRPDFLPHVFERFRQGDSSSTRTHGGLGLGLAIVRHLVELHGGSVTAESGGEGCGATFTITLPLIRASASATPDPSAATSVGGSLRLEGVRVLVVDDDADARDFTSALLEQHGAQVTSSPSARAARDLLEHTTPDVLVSDIGMPGEDGFALIGEVRALGAIRGFWIPAIALTAYAQAEDRNQALSAGYQVHLAKPVDPAALIASVAELVAIAAAYRSTRS